MWDILTLVELKAWHFWFSGSVLRIFLNFLDFLKSISFSLKYCVTCESNMGKIIWIIPKRKLWQACKTNIFFSNMLGSSAKKKKSQKLVRICLSHMYESFCKYQWSTSVCIDVSRIYNTFLMLMFYVNLEILSVYFIN